MQLCGLLQEPFIQIVVAHLSIKYVQLLDSYVADDINAFDI